MSEFKCGEALRSVRYAKRCEKPVDNSAAIDRSLPTGNVYVPLCNFHASVERRSRFGRTVVEITEEVATEIRRVNAERAEFKAQRDAAKAAESERRRIHGSELAAQANNTAYDVRRADEEGSVDWETHQYAKLPTWLIVPVGEDPSHRSGWNPQVQIKPEYGQPRIRITNAGGLTPNEASALRLAIELAEQLLAEQEVLRG